MDMKSGFYMSTIHPVSRRLLGIRHPITKRIWRWVRAPMGLASSPFSYSQRIMALVKELDQWPKFRGVRIVRGTQAEREKDSKGAESDSWSTGGQFVGIMTPIVSCPECTRTVPTGSWEPVSHFLWTTVSL